MLTPRVMTTTGPKFASVPLRRDGMGEQRQRRARAVAEQLRECGAHRPDVDGEPGLRLRELRPDAVAPTTAASTAGRSKRLASAATVLSSRARE